MTSQVFDVTENMTWVVTDTCSVSSGSLLKVAVLGAGTFAKTVAYEIMRRPDMRLIGFVVGDEFYVGGASLLGLPVWPATEMPWGEYPRLVGGIVSPKRRELCGWLRGRGFLFAAVVHRAAWVHPTAVVGPGSFVNAMAVVDMEAELGFCAVVNRGATVGHNARIGDFATVGPGANVSGRTVIGDSATVGMGANVLDGIAVGEGAVVGAGAVVTRDVGPWTTVMGVPAREVAR